MPGADNLIPTPLDFTGEMADAAEHFRQNRLDEALKICLGVQETTPEYGAALFLAGGVALRRGDLAKSLERLRAAATLLPRAPEVAGALMLVCDAAGISDEADEWQRRFDVLRAQDSVFSRAQTIREAADSSVADGRQEEAEQAYQEALECQPAYVEAWNNLGNLKLAIGDTQQAISCFQSALLYNPAVADVYVNLANALAALDQHSQAIAHYRQALEIKSDHVAAKINLGKLMAETGDNTAAAAHYEAVLDIEPNNPLAPNNLASLRLEEGDYDGALEGFSRVMAVQPSDGMRMRMAIALPKIMPGDGQLEALRASWESGLAELEEKPLSIPHPWSDVGITNFGSVYHGVDERPNQERIARIYRTASPTLSLTAAHCDGRERRPGPIRIALVSRHLYQHTIGRLFGGYVSSLDRDAFEVQLYLAGSKFDAFAQELGQSASLAVALPLDVEQARAQIAEGEPDIVFYPDIGMEPLTYFLAFARLAPVQCVTWGHPMTTGIDTVDYFVSSRLIERDDADADFSEQLVRLDGLSMYLASPDWQAATKLREDFGMPARQHVYICPQSTFKFHPEFDAIIADILRQDGSGLVYLLEGRSPTLTEALRQRLAKSAGDVANRIRFLPALPNRDFLDAIAAADVMLDPIHFGGGITSLEAIATGTPIVTLPGPFTRSRLTAAWFRRMEITETVAADRDAYIQLAIGLSGDSERRADISQRMADARSVLYEDRETIADLEEFFMGAMRNVS